MTDGFQCPRNTETSLNKRYASATLTENPETRVRMNRYTHSMHSTGTTGLRPSSASYGPHYGRSALTERRQMGRGALRVRFSREFAGKELERASATASASGGPTPVGTSAHNAAGISPAAGRERIAPGVKRDRPAPRRALWNVLLITCGWATTVRETSRLWSGGRWMAGTPWRGAVFSLW